ncbi:MAG: STAS domain-containing protein [Phycisphaerae bacterium]
MPAGRPSLVSSRRERGAVEVLTVHADDVSEADLIGHLGVDLRRAIDAGGADADAFVLDLSDVRFLTSAALGMLINIHAHLADRGCRLALAGATGNVARVFKQARLEELLPVCPTVGEAIDILRPC